MNYETQKYIESLEKARKSEIRDVRLKAIGISFSILLSLVIIGLFFLLDSTTETNYVSVENDLQGPSQNKHEGKQSKLSNTTTESKSISSETKTQDSEISELDDENELYLEIDGRADDQVNTNSFSNLSDIENSPQEKVVIEQKQVVVPGKQTPFFLVQDMPQFPGGNDSLEKYISSNLKYPVEARKYNVSGTVYVKYIIRNTGKVDQAVIADTLGYGCDEEALRLVYEMPDWIPGKHKGNKVDVYYTLPIVFERRRSLLGKFFKS